MDKNNNKLMFCGLLFTSGSIIFVTCEQCLWSDNVVFNLLDHPIYHVTSAINIAQIIFSYI